MVDLKEMSFLVTGGFGFIGSHIVEKLLKRGAKFVRILDNDSLKIGINNLKFLKDYNNYEIMYGDLVDYYKCLEAVEGIDAICHQAALVSIPLSIKNPILTNQTNVIGFNNIINAAKQNCIKRFVYASSSAVYGDNEDKFKVESKIGNQLSPYGLTKLIGEQYAKLYTDTYGLECIGLRYFNVYGPRQNIKGSYASVIPKFIDKIIKKEIPYIYGDGNNTRDFIYVEDIAEANIIALTTDNKVFGEVFNIGTGNYKTINDVYSKISQILEFDKLPYIYPYRKGDIEHSCANINKSLDKLGFVTKTKFKEGVMKTIEYYFNI